MDHALNALITSTIHSLLAPSSQFEPPVQSSFHAQNPLLSELTSITQSALLPKKTVLNALYKQAQRSVDPSTHATLTPAAPSSQASAISPPKAKYSIAHPQDQSLIEALERLRSKSQTRGFSRDSKIIPKK